MLDPRTFRALAKIAHGRGHHVPRAFMTHLIDEGYVEATGDDTYQLTPQGRHALNQ